MSGIAMNAYERHTYMTNQYTKSNQRGWSNRNGWMKQVPCRSTMDYEKKKGLHGSTREAEQKRRWAENSAGTL